ncbi:MULTISPECIES: uracil-DNA glycosylase [unclassified Prochlorococcus]|uniref:uracil-DNA glycosylase n=1 Tax=unclassified Prochlorococcus TaxID=2627481 RepID=UPI000533A772|nr:MULTISPECIES: uracil-DNA glycosylase [unclassified Prochlorococcus]KGG15341.1 Uracil-DNA glycosylase [Prochlorococcus sp. MIT 0602]KGG17619.1 Uracil-DNA glycosylase [Prochlorococcus sp. MIT 0603]
MTINDSLGNPICQSCGISDLLSPVVIGKGDKSSPLMLIGEAPGAMEEKLTVPFVGRSGKLLDLLLTQAGFDLCKDVYITNLIKTRPPNNRVPTKKEISLHLPWLYQQIKLVKPLVILLLGSSALHAILGERLKITETRGTWHNWNGILLMPIFHPSYLLRNPSKLEGKPYNLTSIDLNEVHKKLTEFNSI